MKDEYKIKGITPYNDFYFNNCSYSILFSLCFSYERPVYPLLLNEFYTYQYDKEYHALYYETHFIKDIPVLLQEDLRIHQHSCFKKETISRLYANQ